MALKRRQRRVLGRQGLKITTDVDRGKRIIADPDKYFAEARERAKAQVARDMEREQRLAKA